MTPAASAAAPTEFLPAETLSLEEVLRQHAMLADDPLIRELLDGEIGLALILNGRRQIVFCNAAFRERLRLRDEPAVLGQRFGGAAGCVRAASGPNACGTTAACRDCAVAVATASALAGRGVDKPCRIATRVCGEDLNLSLRSSPLRYREEDFVLLSALDVGAELRRRVLESMFFHDVLNTASGVQGLLQVMAETDDEALLRRYLPPACRAADDLLEELSSQRDLAAAEAGELKVRPAETDGARLLSELAAMFSAHPLARGRRVAAAGGGVRLTTDRILLTRVLVNLTKNALEAEPPGRTVELSCGREGDRAVFAVRNPSFMPERVQHQVFQRFFSTRGENRGLGTYGARLLVENCLGGALSFESSREGGTTFRASLPLVPRSAPSAGGSGS